MITHPELNSKIDLMIGLAPAAAVANTRSLLRHSAAFVNPIEVSFLGFLKSQSVHALFSLQSFLRLIRTRAFLPNSGIPKRVREVFCERTLREATLCRNFIFLVAGADPHNFNIVSAKKRPHRCFLSLKFAFSTSYSRLFL